MSVQYVLVLAIGVLTLLAAYSITVGSLGWLPVLCALIAVCLLVMVVLEWRARRR